MSCVSNIAALVAKLERAATAVQIGTVTGVNEAALVMTTAIRAEINSASHGGQMRGVGRNGTRVGARFLPATAASHPVALVKATGPLHLLERDNRAHTILPRRARALSIGRDTWAASVAHPGSRGKHPFEKGKLAGTPLAEAALARVTATAVRSVL